MTLGEIIRTAREQKKMSIHQLAVESEVTPMTIWKIEKGRTKNPSFKTLFKITEVLGADILYWVATFKENNPS